MLKKRQRIDIICDMLTSIQKNKRGVKPTHLMYSANLAHRQLKSYLEELINKNFVKRVKRKNYEYITITENGTKFMQKIKEMKEFEDTFGFE